MKKQLPERPNLEHLKNQAKQLLSDLKEGTPEALQRLEACHFKPIEPALNQAQVVIAREYGFASWPRLKKYVEDITGSLDLAAKRLVELTFIEQPNSGLNETIRKLVALHPGLDSFDLSLAATMGNANYVREALAKDPQATNRKTGVAGMEPLACALFSWFLRNDESRKPGVREVVQELLKSGANPNLIAKWGEYELPVLYGATGAAHDVELSKIMLDAGASPNDGESCYHGVEVPGHAILELLFDKGVNEENKVHALFRKLDFDDLDTVRWLLDHGCSPNLRWPADQATPLMQALNRDRSLPFFELLLERGADPNLADDHGQTAYQLAVTLGRTDVAELLLSHGASSELGEFEHWLKAVLAGVKPHSLPNFESLGRSQRDVAFRFASKGRSAELICILDAGFPEDLGLWATPLHAACWHGKHEVAKLLIKRGAALELKDPVHNSTPVGWTMHGSVFCKASSPEDYVDTLRALADAGAKLPTLEENYWQEEGSASPEIQEWLIERLSSA